MAPRGKELKICSAVVLILPPISTADYVFVVHSYMHATVPAHACLCACPHHGAVTLWQIGPDSNAMRRAALQLELTNKPGHNTAR